MIQLIISPNHANICCFLETYDNVYHISYPKRKLDGPCHLQSLVQLCIKFITYAEREDIGISSKLDLFVNGFNLNLFHFDTNLK